MKHGDFVYYRDLTPFFRGDSMRGVAVYVLKVIYEGTIAQETLQENLTKMMYNITKGLGDNNS